MVKVYTKASCAPCQAVKRWLQQKGIAFEEKDISEPENAAEAMKLSGYSIVPVVVVEKLDQLQVIAGLNYGRLAQLVGQN